MKFQTSSSLRGKKKGVGTVCLLTGHPPSLLLKPLPRFTRKPRDTGLVWGNENGRLAVTSSLTSPLLIITRFRTRAPPQLPPAQPRSPGGPALPLSSLPHPGPVGPALGTCSPGAQLQGPHPCRRGRVTEQGVF